MPLWPWVCREDAAPGGRTYRWSDARERGGAMKIYIITDMEGVSGICNEQQVQRDSPAYAEGRELLIGDINAAVAGAFDGGATEGGGNEGHGGAFNLLPGPMVPRARSERPQGGPGMRRRPPDPLTRA